MDSGGVHRAADHVQLAFTQQEIVVRKLVLTGSKLQYVTQASLLYPEFNFGSLSDRVQY
jgi:hypothetical protein